MKNILICKILLIFFTQSLLAQNDLDKIRKSREETLKQIDYANKLLNETEGKSKQSLNEIDLINHKLSKRREYLGGLTLESSILEQAINENISSSNILSEQINEIKSVYEKIIYSYFKNNIKNYRFMYLLASENLNQFYKRVKILKLYARYLRSEKEKFELSRNLLKKKNEELLKLKSEKNSVIRVELSENRQIEKEVLEKKKALQRILKKKKEIEEEIKLKEKTANALEKELKKLIDDEKIKIQKSSSKESLTPSEKVISNDFEKNLGRLPWPTEHGIITGKYGEHQHPDYNSVTIRNDGIYITTNVGENARSIFNGTVSRVFTLPGEKFTVIIKHGNYYSLYHNLEGVKVKPGQKVSTKEIIGKVYTNENTKETVLLFQIWEETEKKDPELWLVHN